MKEQKDKKVKNENKYKNKDRGQMFVRIMASILALMMIVGAVAGFIYAIFA